MTETEPLITSRPASSVASPMRWLLLMEFCSLAFLQSSIFLGWNPIANSALFAFGPDWSASTLAWQINLATITSPFIQYPVWKSIKRFNLGRTIRWLAVFPLVLASFLNTLPLFFNVFSSQSYKWLSYASFLFTGLTGVVFFSCVTRFSSTWFPIEERATSTGLACVMANLGGILPSLVGPQLVSDPFKHPLASKEAVGHEIHLYMLMYFILSTVLFIIFWCHFPDNEFIDQPDLNQSVGFQCVKVLSSTNVVLIVLVASLGSIPHIWGSTLLTVTLSKLKISQEFVGIVTTLSLFSSTVFTLFLSRVADVYFAQHLKHLMMFFMPVHALTMIGMCICIFTGSPEANRQYLIGFLYVIAIGVLNSLSPLLLELASELTNPISEDIIAGVINQANNFVGVVFYLVFSYVSTRDYNWLLYLLMTLPVITFSIFSITKESYNRRSNVEIAQ